MKWLARLKNANTLKPHATEPTKPPQGPENTGSVGFVAYPQGVVQKIERMVAAANDVPAPAKRERQISLAAGTSPTTVDLFRAASQALDARTAAAEHGETQHDGSWPHGEAMNGHEIDAFMARLARFTDKGLSLEDSEALADWLVKRDREHNDRSLCMECTHLQGTGGWRCSDWKTAGVAADGLSREGVLMLQRCNAFKEWSRL